MQSLHLEISMPSMKLVIMALRLIARTILKLKYDDGYENYVELPNGTRRYFKDLVSHKEEILQDYRKMIQFNSLYSILEMWFGDIEQIPSKEIVLEIFGKILINSITLVDEYGDHGGVIGKGLFLDASVINHSCIPNAIYVYHGKELIVKTIEEIGNFSDLRLCYINNLISTEKRRKILMEQYFFHCQCLKCEDKFSDLNNSSLICHKCQGCVPSVGGSCNNCGLAIENLTIENFVKLKKKIQWALLLCRNNHSDDQNNYESELLKDLFEEALRIFHPYDEDFFKLLDSSKLYEHYYFELGDYEKCLHILRLKLSNYKQNWPAYFPNIASHLIDMMFLCQELKYFSEAKGYLNRAEDILKVVYGDTEKECPLLIQCLNLHNK